MFENYDIQRALLKAQAAVSLFEENKYDASSSKAIKELRSLILLNETKNHLQKHDIRLRAIYKLGGLYEYRYGILGNENDMICAIHFYKLSKRFMGEYHPDLPSVLNNLANLLLDNYLIERNPIFLEMAINYLHKADEFYKKTTAFESIDRNNRPIIFNGLGNALHERYAATGSIGDLNASIDFYEKAVKNTSTTAPIHSIALDNLAKCLKDRFNLNKELIYLDEAIQNWFEAIRLTKDTKYLPGIFSNLGEGLKDRYIFNYRYSNNKELAVRDLEDAIKFSQKAVESSPNRPIDKALYLGNLGNQLRELHIFFKDSSRLREASDRLDSAIEAFEEVIHLLPEGSRDRTMSFYNLGRALRDKYNLTSNVSFLLESFNAYKEASKSLNTTSYVISISYELGTRKMLGDIEDRVVETALILRDLATEEPNIEGIQDLIWGREAMLYAEGVKSIILIKLLGRGNIPTPPSLPLDLIKKEEKLMEELNKIDLRELSRFGEPIRSRENIEGKSTIIQNRIELLRELDILWNQIESYGPDAEEYTSLRRGNRPSWNNIKNLIENPTTALLSLFPLAEKTVLFILRADWEEPEIVEIPLGGEAQLDIWRRFRREVHLYNDGDQLRETWDRNLIQLLNNAIPYLEGIQRVIFSPGRFGCLLPWEALLQKAGLNIEWAAIPNLRIRSIMAKYDLNSNDSVLIIGNPKGGNDLIYAEEEARAIAKLFGITPLIGSQATKEMVLNCLSKANIAHFATHAYFSLENPLDSGIVLADGIIKIRDIIDLHIHLKLLVLSACETGMNSSLAGDEMAGFAQSFILAGAKSTLVSLWKVNDLSTAELMLSFYNHWINHSENNACALSHAMREIRNQEEWKNTYYWGAFTLVGDIVEYNI
jgi:CHAT domain-containing protein/tetratricopeptide (TPR) repeat protein